MVMTEFRVFLCALQELPKRASRGFMVETPAGVQDIFVVRDNTLVVAYYNSCPHTGAPLDWVPDQFLSLDGSQIQCATHDARFRVEDGVCIAGPCTGKRLSAVVTVVEKEAVYAEFSIQGRSGDK
jgi:nitrite reductase/ring-hydroxylating ferredoxin subunit